MIRFGHHTLFILLIVVNFFDSQAQSFIPAYNFRHLTIQNGLTQNIIYHFLQDSRGYLWIGTHNGLTIYDGTRTVNFLHNEQDKNSLSGNFITCILEDSAQNVWIGNETGIDLYNRPNNNFTHFGVDRPDGTKDNTYCVPLGFVSAKDLWFLDTKTKAIRSLNIKSGSTAFISDLDANHALFYQNKKTQFIHIWSSYDKGTIHKVFRNSREIGQHEYFSGGKDHPESPVLEVHHVLQQNDSTVWLSTNEGLVKLNPLKNTYRIFNRMENRFVRELRFAAISQTGQVWVGSGPSGIYRFDPITGQFDNNFRNDKLDPFSICSDNIVALYFDRTGNIWCGSYGNGCSYTNIEHVFFAKHISKKETQAWKSSNNISWLGADRNENAWCTFADFPGFWILDKRYKIKMYRNPLLENGKTFTGSIYKIHFGLGTDTWIATNKGLFLYTLRTNIMRPVPYTLMKDDIQGSIWINDMISLNDGSLLFSTFAGLYRVIQQSGKPVVKPLSFLEPGVFDGFGHIFQTKSGSIFVKTLGDSFYILKPNNVTKNFDLVHSLKFIPEINHYFSDSTESSIYLSTNDGLYQIDNQNYLISKPAFSNKLPFLNVSSVFKKDHTFWIFGEKGIYYFDERNKTGRTYTVEDGLPANEFSLSALLYTSDGRCLAGSSNGLVSFYPKQKQDSIYPPGIQFTGIYINDVQYTSTVNPNETVYMSLSHYENTFSFDFAPVAFQHASACNFEYKLDGYDEHWIRTDIAHYTRYSKIPPGTYHFNLRVLDARGGISPFTKTVEIKIARAFWQTNLFKFAVFAIGLLSAWLLFRWYFSYKIRKQKYKFEKQQAIERERTRIATDMHDDLGAGLSRIKFISQSIGNKLTDDQVLKSELEKITVFSDEMSEKMGEIVWALNERNDTLADLIAYSRSYTIEYLANHQIHCEADTPLGLPGNFIAGEIRRNIFLSIKECLHNIVKHAGASTVNFSVVLSDIITITIHDNGKGIELNNPRPFSNGIQNIQNRMKEIRGEVKFSNQQGTKVVLIIPINV